MVSWHSFPLFVYLMVIAGLAMFVPSVHALRLGDFEIARVFFYSAILVLFLSGVIAMAMMNRRPRITARSHLTTLLGAYFLLPLLLALPFAHVAPGTNLLRAYFEMVSSMTTTGATLYVNGGDLGEALNLWRVVVAWLGGLLALVAALAIMEPLNIGGFEIRSTIYGARPGEGASRVASVGAEDRILRHARAIAPIYVTLTLVLSLGLIFAGDRPFVAVCHAMSTLSTSGISPVASLDSAGSGVTGEVLIFLFLFFAVSYRLMYDGLQKNDFGWMRQDAELRMAVAITVGLTFLLFVRHWIGAFEADVEAEAWDVLRAIWGSLFTVMSFLTTMGFESQYWGHSQDWSGLETPGIFLIGLALLGGGIATTAGGAKLLRVYALYKHGLREMEKLSNPSSIGGSGTVARRIRREGAYIAWILLMIFSVSLACVILALSLCGLDLSSALVLAVSTLSTTGPLVETFGNTSASYASLNPWAQGVLCAAMILGRLEALAVIAALNPDYWRR